MLRVFQSQEMKATHIHPNSRKSVQMWDSQMVNNNFYSVFRRNCEEMNPTELMAPELHEGTRIYMSLVLAA